MAVAIRLCVSAINLLTILVDWVNIAIIMHDNGLLLQILCRMLCLFGDAGLQLSAIECLLVIASRKVRTGVVLARFIKKNQNRGFLGNTHTHTHTSRFYGRFPRVSKFTPMVFQDNPGWPISPQLK
jgi:hypothetical protein